MTQIFDQARKMGVQMEAEGNSLKGRVNVYACTPPLMPGSSMKGGCGYSIVTVDRDTGVTPMFVRCGHCGGTATSRMYRVGCSRDEATHEWFRPATEAELPKGYSLASVADHLKNGGLLLRPLGKDKWLKPTPAQRAFMRDEQQRFARLTAAQPTAGD